jgi:2-dehydro-3-deoxygluconokinase
MSGSAAPIVALLGECMLEMSPVRETPGTYRLGVAGDTFNTAIGLSRLGIATEYLTGLGEDSYSDRILREAADSGIGVSNIQRVSGHQPGLYLVENDETGERQFTYWRNDSAARVTLQNARALLQLLNSVENPGYLYLSGISLALCGDAGREALWPWLTTYRAAGGKLIYDSNFRAPLWSSQGVAAEAHRQMVQRADIFLPSVEDELTLRGLQDKSALTDALAELEGKEVVLKDGAAGVMLRGSDGSTSIEAAPTAQVIDTSGAGDAFNAGYLAARLRSLPAATAAEFGCQVAAATVQVPGAVLPAEEWLVLVERLDDLAAGSGLQA